MTRIHEFAIQTPYKTTDKKIMFYNNYWFDDYFLGMNNWKMKIS